jgi:hypothetical protein
MKTKMKPIEKAHARRRELGEQTKLMVIDAIGAAKEPVTAREIGMYIAKNNKRRFSHEYVLNLLNKMSAEGRVYSREETVHERLIRTKFTGPASIPARLYSLSQTVPARTLHEVLPDVNYYMKFANDRSLKIVSWKPGDQSRTVRPARKPIVQTDRPAEVAQVQTDSNSEIERLRARVLELEAQISTLRKILS